MSEKTDAILEALAGKALTAAQVADATGDDQKKCSAMLTYMKTRGMVDLVDKLWQLPGAKAAKSDDAATPPRKSRAKKLQRTAAKVQSAGPASHVDVFLTQDGGCIVVMGDQVLARVPAAAVEAIRAL
jgi:hypothetical protein